VSTAECRRCSGLISFVLADNDRWRPVEAQYLALETDEDEVVALMVEGTMRAQKASSVRVYRYHRCPEDPSLRRGQARTVVVAPEVVDLETGVVEQVPERTYPTREPYRCDTCGAVDDHDEDECPEDDEATARNVRDQRHYAYCVARIPRTQVGNACPVCDAPKGEPCWDPHGRYRSTTHHQRGWVTAFGDDEPWPPEPRQRGYAVMNRWLAIHSDLFATPQEVQ
jgi:hypothetical protein